MSPVYVEDGRLVVDPEATSIELPEILDQEFLAAVFSCSPGEPGHIAELYRLLSPAQRDRFEDACTNAGGRFADDWALAHTQWASVGTLTGVWEVSGLSVRIKRDVHTWLIDHLYADAFGFWYAECWNPKGKSIILSDAEFHARYGDSFVEHLRKFVEFMPIRVNQLVTAMESQWVEYNLTLMRDGRIATEIALGPAEIPPKEWVLKPGDQFISAERR